MKKPFIGTWKLVHSIEIDEQGNRHYPFGDDAVGYIIYDEAGIMAVQITRKNRDKSKVDVLSDYLAYFGPYTIDEENQLVSHHLVGELSSQRVGSVQKRQYQFLEGDRLLLKPWNDGTNREILWERVK